MVRSAVILSLFVTATLAAHICEVVLDSFTQSIPQIQLKNVNYDFTGDHFNVISYNDFNANTGDIEGRAAVKSNVKVGAGYSFGYELITAGPTANDIHLPYSLVAGGNVDYPSGALYPQGNGFPYPGAKEIMYVGGTFTGPQYMLDDADLMTNKNTEFTNSKAYYTALQAAFAGVTSNVNVIPVLQVLKIQCPNLATTSYTATITASVFNYANEWQLQGCNPDAQFVFNIVGDDDVVFSGNNGITGAKKERVLFNIVDAHNVKVYTEIQGGVLAPNANYIQPGGVVKGQVIVNNVEMVLQINIVKCVIPDPTPNPDELCPGFETDCAGLQVASLSAQEFSLREFNAIVFEDFTANTGDIEGRLFVGGNFVAGAGYTIGYELITANNIPDLSLPYSLIVGGDLQWTSGSIHPDGTGYPHGGNGEQGYIGGTVSNTDQSIADRLTQGDAAKIAAELADAKTCYQGYSDRAAAKTDNTVSQIAFSGLFVQCNDATATEYVLSVTGAQLAQITYYSVSGCNFQANWIINVRGTDDVAFSGDNFPAIPGAILYNVVDATKVTISNIAFRSHLLATKADLALTSASWGKIVVKSVSTATQFNKQNTCPDIVTIRIPILAREAAAQGATSVAVYGADTFQVGDLTELGIVIGINGNVLTFNAPLTRPVSAGSIITYATIPSNSGRGADPNFKVDTAATTGSASGATTVGVAAALVIVALAI